MDVSVVIPVRRDRRIESCLEAVTCQDFSGNHEVIVVENDADQPLRPLIAKYPVRYECCTEVGSYHARHVGVQAARGSIVAFTDADCVPDTRWLRELCRGFSDGQIAGVGGRIENYDGETVVANHQREFLLEDGLQYLRPICPLPYAPTGNVAYRCEVLDSVGGFDTTFFSGGDVDLAWRIQQADYRLVYNRNALVKHRPRDRLGSYFRQYYRYGLGQVMLFRKHKQRLGKHMVFNGYPFKGIVSAAASLATSGLYRLAVHRDAGQVAARLLDLTEHSALILSAMVGSARYRVLYI